MPNYYKPKSKFEVKWFGLTSVEFSEELAQREPIPYMGPVIHAPLTTMFSNLGPMQRSGFNIRTSWNGPTGSEFPLAQTQKNDQTQRIAKGYARRIKLKEKNKC